MFQRLWLFKVPVGRIALILFAGIALIGATISGFSWFTAKSSAVTTGQTPTQPESLSTTLVFSNSQAASLKIETLGTSRFRRRSSKSRSPGSETRFIGMDRFTLLAFATLPTLPNANVIETFPLSSLMAAWIWNQ